VRRFLFLTYFCGAVLFVCSAASLLVTVSADAAGDPFRKACRKELGWSNGYARTITERSSPSLYMAFQNCVSKRMAASTTH